MLDRNAIRFLFLKNLPPAFLDCRLDGKHPELAFGIYRGCYMILEKEVNLLRLKAGME